MWTNKWAQLVKVLKILQKVLKFHQQMTENRVLSTAAYEPMDCRFLGWNLSKHLRNQALHQQIQAELDSFYKHELIKKVLIFEQYSYTSVTVSIASKLYSTYIIHRLNNAKRNYIVVIWVRLSELWLNNIIHSTRKSYMHICDNKSWKKTFNEASTFLQ